MRAISCIVAGGLAVALFSGCAVVEQEYSGIKRPDTEIAVLEVASQWNVFKIDGQPPKSGGRPLSAQRNFREFRLLPGRHSFVMGAGSSTVSGNYVHTEKVAPLAFSIDLKMGQRYVLAEGRTVSDELNRTTNLAFGHTTTPTLPLKNVTTGAKSQVVAQQLGWDEKPYHNPRAEFEARLREARAQGKIKGTVHMTYPDGTTVTIP